MQQCVCVCASVCGVECVSVSACCFSVLSFDMSDRCPKVSDCSTQFCVRFGLCRLFFFKSPGFASAGFDDFASVGFDDFASVGFGAFASVGKCYPSSFHCVCVFHCFSQSAQLLHSLRGHAAASGEEATSLSSCCSASRSGACPCHCQATSCSECANTATKYFEVFLLRALRRCAWTCLAQMLQPGAAWLRCCSKCHFVAQRHQRQHHHSAVHH